LSKILNYYKYEINVYKKLNLIFLRFIRRSPLYIYWYIYSMDFDDEQPHEYRSIYDANCESKIVDCSNIKMLQINEYTSKKECKTLFSILIDETLLAKFQHLLKNLESYSHSINVKFYKSLVDIYSNDLLNCMCDNCAHSDIIEWAYGQLYFNCGLDQKYRCLSITYAQKFIENIIDTLSGDSPNCLNVVDKFLNYKGYYNTTEIKTFVTHECVFSSKIMTTSDRDTTKKGYFTSDNTMHIITTKNPINNKNFFAENKAIFGNDGIHFNDVKKRKNNKSYFATTINPEDFDQLENVLSQMYDSLINNKNFTIKFPFTKKIEYSEYILEDRKTHDRYIRVIINKRYPQCSKISFNGIYIYNKTESIMFVQFLINKLSNIYNRMYLTLRRIAHN